MMMEIHSAADGECVSQSEFAAVKAELENRVDQLHSQLNYWQNVTVNTLSEHCSSLTTGIRASVDALCRDGTSEISRDPRTKRLQTRRARPSKHTNNF